MVRMIPPVGSKFYDGARFCQRTIQKIKISICSILGKINSPTGFGQIFGPFAKVLQCILYSIRTTNRRKDGLLLRTSENLTPCLPPDTYTYSGWNGVENIYWQVAVFHAIGFCAYFHRNLHLLPWKFPSSSMETSTYFHGSKKTSTYFHGSKSTTMEASTNFHGSKFVSMAISMEVHLIPRRK